MCLPKSRTIAGGSLLSLIRYKEFLILACEISKNFNLNIEK